MLDLSGLPGEIYRRSACAVALAVLLGVACDEEGFAPRQGKVPPLTSPAHSPLYVHYPSLDRRIARVDPTSGKTTRVLYLDRHRPALRAVRDFAVDHRRLYALTGSRCAEADSRLLVIDEAKDRLVAELRLPPEPDRLLWGGPGRLLVGHGASPGEGPLGRLALVDTRRLALVGQLALEGGFVAATVVGTRRVYVVERTFRSRGEAAIAPAALVEVALDGLAKGGKGALLRRMALPPGARQVVLGPTGLLYVAHASGEGTLETDGTITVVDPEVWRVVDRIRPEMAVRGMAATARYLLLNQLSTTGDVWLAVVDRAHRTVFDVKLPTLNSRELAVVGTRAFTAPRRGNELPYIDLAALAPRRLRLVNTSRPKQAPTEQAKDPPGFLRTQGGDSTQGSPRAAR